MLIGAAAAWAVTIVFVRVHRFAASALALAPWQMALAAALLLPIAIGLEGAPRALDLRGVLSLAFVGPVATAFAYWAVIEAGRRLRASAVAMALLAAPVLGLLISAATLGESIDPSLLAGAALIGSGILLSIARKSAGSLDVPTAQWQDSSPERRGRGSRGATSVPCS
jgi:drug/metabolite transporter (DMT)-like permease